MSTLDIFEGRNSRLHVRFMNPDTIYVGGVFTFPGQPPIIVDSNGVVTTNGKNTITVAGNCFSGGSYINLP